MQRQIVRAVQCLEETYRVGVIKHLDLQTNKNYKRKQEVIRMWSIRASRKTWSDRIQYKKIMDMEGTYLDDNERKQLTSYGYFFIKYFGNKTSYTGVTRQ